MLTTEALVAEIPEKKEAPSRRRTRRRHGRHVLALQKDALRRKARKGAPPKLSLGGVFFPLNATPHCRKLFLRCRIRM